MTDESIVKIHIELPHHWATGGESMWAEDLGNDRYQICNVPFHAYGLNFKDIVIAKPQSDDQIPEIVEVVERSGNETIRLYFEDDVSEEEQVKILDNICSIGASYERADKVFVAIDINQKGKYGAVYDSLQHLEDDGKLNFETCEMRVQGSFDDTPPDETEE